MSNYILCQVKRAELPYYIENISTNIYSIEELCFYFYHNLYLLDDTIINEKLCVWIRDELGLKKLAQKLQTLLAGEWKLGDFTLLVFKEINYLNIDELRKFNQQLMKMAAEPALLREKLKGDCLMGHGKTINAIRVYQNVLKERGREREEKAGESDRLGSQFVGAVYHNMGCAYAKLFQMEDALRCFEKSYESMRTAYSIKSYLCVVYLEHGTAAFAKKAMELGVDEQKMYEVLEEIARSSETMLQSREGQIYAQALEAKQQGNMGLYHEILDEMIRDLKKEYHRNTNS